MAPPSQELEPPINPERFKRVFPISLTQNRRLFEMRTDKASREADQLRYDAQLAHRYVITIDP
jgi:hypothetical protein